MSPLGRPDVRSDSTPARGVGYAELRSVTLGDVRAVFSPRCYQRSTSRALAGFLFDASLYAVALGGVFAFENPLIRMAFGLLAGGAVALLFVWAHDAAHGALFTSDVISEVLGTAAMLPSLQMYRLWTYGHNRVHHGFTSFSPIDWVWRPLTPAQYQARSRWGRAVYRLERHPATCGLHYLLHVWWAGMVRFQPAQPGRRIRYRWSKALTLTFAAAFGVAAYRFAGGWVGVISAVVVPFLVFTYVIALVVYLHHTHPDVPFFTDRREWSPVIGPIVCSTAVRSNPLIEFLTHHILVHPPHHVDTRIPYYRLPQAHAELSASYGGHICEYRLRWSAVRHIFSRCQLYDFVTHTWHRFAELSATDGSPAPGPPSCSGEPAGAHTT